MNTTRYNQIDRLGDVRSQIEALEVQEAKLRAEVIALGVGTHQGRFFKAYVLTGTRFTLSIDTAKAKLKALGVGARWFARHTESSPVTTVKVRCTTAHNLIKKAA